jgi:phosphopantothenoylcysteine decarboxylase/phosphopantothenate--cysteine ligase
MIVGNLVNREGMGFESEINEVTLVTRAGSTISLPAAPKRVVADQIFDEVLRLRLKLHASAT